MDIVSFLIVCLVTAISLIIISYIPIGVEVDSFPKALISAIVFGLLNAFVRPALAFITAPVNWLSFGLFTLVLNAIIFGLAAWLVTGFRLRYGIISAFLGAIALTFVNSILFRLFDSLS